MNAKVPDRQAEAAGKSRQELNLSAAAAVATAAADAAATAAETMAAAANTLKKVPFSGAAANPAASAGAASQTPGGISPAGANVEGRAKMDLPPARQDAAVPGTAAPGEAGQSAAVKTAATPSVQSESTPALQAGPLGKQPLEKQPELPEKKQAEAEQPGEKQPENSPAFPAAPAAAATSTAAKTAAANAAAKESTAASEKAAPAPVPAEAPGPQKSRSPNDDGQKGEQSGFGRALAAGLILALTGGICLGALILADHQTHELIAAHSSGGNPAVLSRTMLPPEASSPGTEYPCYLISGTKTGRNMRLYTAVNGGRITGYLMQHSTSRGYANPLIFITGFDENRKIYRTDILISHETPGLGDKIDRRHGNFLDQFSGKELVNVGWDVKKFGGSFDYISGATVTSRAAVLAARDALELLQHTNPKSLSPCGSR